MAQEVATTRSTVRVMVIVCADASEAAASAAHHPWMRIGFVRWVWTGGFWNVPLSGVSGPDGWVR